MKAKKLIQIVALSLFVGVLNLASAQDKMVLSVYANPIATAYGMATDHTEIMAGVEFGKPSWGGSFPNGTIMLEYQYARIGDIRATGVLVGGKSYWGKNRDEFRGFAAAALLGIFSATDGETHVLAFATVIRPVFKLVVQDRVGIEPYAELGFIRAGLASAISVGLGVNLSYRVTL